jgi:hypothetical protein
MRRVSVFVFVGRCLGGGLAERARARRIRNMTRKGSAGIFLSSDDCVGYTSSLKTFLPQGF